MEKYPLEPPEIIMNLLVNPLDWNNLIVSMPMLQGITGHQS